MPRKKVTSRNDGIKITKLNFKTVNKKYKYKQTGTSNKSRDAARSAKPAGWRISKSGNLYFEGRKSHSDKKGSRI